MIFKAAEKFNIELKNSWVVGDSKSDIQAGINAGCKTALVNDLNNNYGQDLTCKNLLEFVNSILKGE